MVAVVGCSSDTVLTLHPDTLPGATVGQPYTVTITQTLPDGSTAGFDVYIPSGLPPGITMSQTNNAGPATLSGTPTTAGTYNFNVQAGGGCTMGGCTKGNRDYTIIVAP